jgi:formylglycine-generating enzyme required for sulfatase activity
MKFVLVPAGSFKMGSEESVQALERVYPGYEVQRFNQLKDETPRHTVVISRAFYLGQYEVTVGQFAKFVALSGYVPESEADGTGGYGYNAEYDRTRAENRDAFEGRNPRYSWRNPGFKQGNNHPVLNVSYADALAMIRWLSDREKVRYRLPTEAEWEYACRAGSQTRYPNGDDPQGLAQIANTFDADASAHWTRWQDKALKAHDGHAFTAPVGSFAPNAFGLYDMLGNAWEWTSDWYSETYYAEASALDPQGPSHGDVRVRRGASWHSWALYTRCSFRNYNTEKSRYPLLGMRLLREVKD